MRLGGTARMAGDPPAVVEDRHRRCGQEDVEPLIVPAGTATE